MPFEPPAGYVDMLTDAEDGPMSKGFRELEVKDVGIVRARKPMPNAVASLAMAANASIGRGSQADYLVLFVKNHLDEGELDRIFYEMMTGEIPEQSISLIAQAVSTWGTPRPT